jgi:EmrB/QacA subfamily drug resistance transporter
MLTFFRDEKNKKWWIVIAMSMSLGMTFIDQTGVAIALPKIQQEFNLSAVSLQWITNAYMLTIAVFLGLGGHLGDLYQHQKVFSLGLAIFMLASLTCAIAPNDVWLTGGRVLQGFGGALLIPNTSVMIINSFDEHERGKAMGFYMTSAILFLPLALLIGGLCTQYVTWRLIFAINIPIGITCLYLVWKLFPKQVNPVIDKSIDWIGLILLVMASSAMVVALMEASTLGWSNPIILLLLLLSVIIFIFYYLFEHVQTNPIIDFAIFKNRVFLCASFLVFCMSFIPGLFIYDAIFYQNILGYKPATAGLLFMPSILCVMLSAPIAGRIMDYYGYKMPVITGLFCCLCGLVLNALLIHWQYYWYLLPGIILINLGAPAVSSVINTAALSSVGKIHRGTASGVLNGLRLLSNSICLAGLTAIIMGAYRYSLITAPPISMHKNVYTHAYSLGIGASAILVVLGLITTFIMFHFINLAKASNKKS